jgi:NADP-dependent 3-hydroxy acid dehydrogenase YdfG
VNVKDAVVVVTGAGSGIGAALARRFAAEGAAAVVVSDRNSEAAAAVAAEIGATPYTVDVTDAAAVADLVAHTEHDHGRLDLFCSNAGIATGAGLDAPQRAWRDAFDVHVMAHVHAARAVLPGMLARGRGYLLNTASAAGLLTAPGDAPYTATKRQRAVPAGGVHPVAHGLASRRPCVGPGRGGGRADCDARAGGRRCN